MKIFELRNQDRSTKKIGNLSINQLPLPRLKFLREFFLFPMIFITFIKEVIKARRNAYKLCLYQKIPSGSLLISGCLPLFINPAFLLFPFARKLKLITWASIHDLSSDHEIRIAELQKRLSINYAKNILRTAKLNELEQRFALKHASFITVTSHYMRQAVIKRYNINLNKVSIFRAR